jgi:membrane protein DedA with SNARE-associated domain
MSSLAALAASYGLPVVTLIIAAEAIGMPLPGETMMIALGASAAAGHVSLVRIFIALWVGAVIGDNIGYIIGRRIGRKAVLRHGGKIGISEDKLAKVEGAFRRHGVVLVLFARFFVVLRQLNGLLAGTLELPWWRFFAANAIGGALWVGFWLYLSSRLSDRLIALMAQAHHLKVAIFILLFIAAVIITAAWLIRRRAAHN